MRRGTFVVGLFLAVFALAAPRAGAEILINFTYQGVPAGTLTMSGGDLSTTNVPMTDLNVSGAPLGNGDFKGVNALLAFDTVAHTLSITGVINSTAPLALNLSGALVSGTITSFSLTPTWMGNYLLSMSGTATEAPGLLTALNIPVDTPFTHFGFVAMINPTGNGTFATNSVGVNNTALPVPDSASTMLLFALGLTGLGVASRKR